MILTLWRMLHHSYLFHSFCHCTLPYRYTHSWWQPGDCTSRYSGRVNCSRSRLKSWKRKIKENYMKSFIAKRVISILVNLRYLRFKLLKYKENNKKICNTFDHNFKNIPLYIMSNVSLERYYFVLYDGALTLKILQMALNAFCDKTLHMQRSIQ